MTIYEIDDRIRSLVDEETGEIKDYAEFENLQMEREEKIENTALWIKELTAESNAIANEIKSLTQRKTTTENKIARLKSYLDAALAGRKYNSPRVLVSYRHSDAVIVDELFAIPDEYLKYKDPDVNKEELKRDIKSGKDIPGCHLEERENIQIK